MPGQEEYNQQMRLLASHRERLVTLLEQQAKFGSLHVPPHVVTDIREAREQIKQIKAIVRSWRYNIEDNPIDIEYVNVLFPPKNRPKIILTPSSVYNQSIPYAMNLDNNTQTTQRKIWTAGHWFIALWLCLFLALFVTGFASLAFFNAGTMNSDKFFGIMMILAIIFFGVVVIVKIKSAKD